MPRKPSSPRPPAAAPPVTPDSPEASPHLEAAEPKPRTPRLPFPIVGIGASAGGLEAFRELLTALPIDTGMAFVLVQHLDPSHESLLTDILQRSTRLPVSEVEERTKVERDHVYVIPPGKNMILEDGALRLSPRGDRVGASRVIDSFLVSLAEEQGHLAIGVILSGTASDGTVGCEEIKAAGGITFAQDSTAQQISMPQSAAAAGSVDLILPPDEIARELGRISRHPFVERIVRDRPEEPVTGLDSIVDLLRKALDVDFTHYKHTTLNRRVTRRMVLHKVEGVQDYLKLLLGDPAELEALFQDILISVTSFFRNPEAFDFLKAEVFPRLTANRSRNEPIRIWVIGCSTGEEAYSIAMAYTEYAEEAGCDVPYQIFASDLNLTMVEKGRAGSYLKTILQDVSADRLQRFFVEGDGSYRIAKSIRDRVVFARHNVLTDPPFSHIDLVSCRNLLIYMEPALQSRVLTTINYALNPGGYAFLGNSETIGTQRDSFDLQQPRLKIYAKKPGASAGPTGVPLRLRPHDAGSFGVRSAEVHHESLASASELQKEADRFLLSRYSPAGVLVDADMEILQFRGDTGPYVAPAPGRATLNLLKMIREGLLIPVRALVQKALREESAVRTDAVRFPVNGGHRTVNLEVIPMKGAPGRQRTCLVLFHDGEPARAEKPKPTSPSSAKSGARAAGRQAVTGETVRLQQELAATREYLQAVIEQQEAANEELQSANEEVQSANEELQSINEELETSKEEVQSSNEELATVNSELNNRNQELGRINSDLINLLTSVQMTIVMLGPDLRIRRFTPAAEKMLSLIGSDVGRPIGDISATFGLGDMERIVTEVIETMAPQQLEVQDRRGYWYSLRVRPYRTVDNRIDGAVLLLVDIDALKRVQESIRASEARFKLLADSAPVLIWVHGPAGCQFVNRAYLDFLGAEEADVEGDGWTSFIHPEDRAAHLAAHREGLAEGKRFDALSRFRRADGEYRWMKSVGCPHFDETGQLLGFVGSSSDVTDLEAAAETLREADRAKNQFLGMLAHELRNPLAPLRNAVHLLSVTQGDPIHREWALETMDRQITHITRMIEDLLDISRITQGKIQLRREPVQVAAMLAQVIEQVGPAITSRRQTLSINQPPPSVMLDADPLRVEQIVSNLLINASKFTPVGGKIRLNASRIIEASGRPTIEIRVADDGIGLSDEVLPFIFDLFMQADSSLDRTQGGLGIGLTLVRRLTDLHGGSVEARSDGPGQGSEFVVRLPAAALGTTRPEEALPPRRRVVDLTPATYRILVVDDNVDAVDTMATLLRVWGHDVRIARDGPAALVEAGAFGPEFVLLDIGLPGQDGFEVARSLRRLMADDLPVLVAISGYSQEEVRRRAADSGFTRHFTKPVHPDELQRFLADAGRRKSGPPGP